MTLNLYLLTQDERNGYDTYDAAIVAAPDEETARRIHPGVWEDWAPGVKWDSWAWASSPENVAVELIGVAAENVKQGVVLASFNAG